MIGDELKARLLIAAGETSDAPWRGNRLEIERESLPGPEADGIEIRATSFPAVDESGRLEGAYELPLDAAADGGEEAGGNLRRESRGERAKSARPGPTSRSIGSQAGSTALEQWRCQGRWPPSVKAR